MGLACGDVLEREGNDKVMLRYYKVIRYDQVPVVERLEKVPIG